uniref:Uncharacterized protein n=1 Tax=Zea mays TaxID=4577 RepID=B6SPU6_MAIZE|nr:hypothetical protein [Zea mays]
MRRSALAPTCKHIPMTFKMESSLYARVCLTEFVIGSEHLRREVDCLPHCHLSMMGIILANISTQDAGIQVCAHEETCTLTAG